MNPKPQVLLLNPKNRKVPKKFILYPFSKQPGLYQITCIPTGKTYIGESKNPTARLTAHKNKLRNHIHDNKHLQEDYLQYGENNFTFQRLQIGLGTDIAKRQEIETLILSTFQPEDRYNAYVNSRRGRYGAANAFYGKALSL